MEDLIKEFSDYLNYEKKYSSLTILNYEKDLDSYFCYLKANKINYKGIRSIVTYIQSIIATTDNKNKLVFVEDITAMIGISDDTYYRLFPIGSDESDNIKQLLQKNKIQLKVALRKKWLDSDNATTQLALYKLCSTETEHRLLQQNYSEVTGKDGAPIASTLTPDQIDKLIDKL